ERQKRSRVPHAHIAAADDAERDALRRCGNVTSKRAGGKNAWPSQSRASEREELSAGERGLEGRRFHAVRIERAQKAVERFWLRFVSLKLGAWDLELGGPVGSTENGEEPDPVPSPRRKKFEPPH